MEFLVDSEDVKRFAKFARLGHLIRRLRESLTIRPIRQKDIHWVESVLESAEWDLWSSMQRIDKVHSIGVGRRMAASQPRVERFELAAALLHDVGKIKSSLGVAARVLATVLGSLTPRWREYHDHERIGAEMCRERGIDERICDAIEGKGPSSLVDRLKRADEL